MTALFLLLTACLAIPVAICCKLAKRNEKDANDAAFPNSKD